MNILGSFMLILAGTLAASAYIISKRPETEHQQKKTALRPT